MLRLVPPWFGGAGGLGGSLVRWLAGSVGLRSALVRWRHWFDGGMGPHDARAGIPALTRQMTGLASLFLTSGMVHLVRPEVMEPIVPRALPAPRRLVYVSGVAELACAAGLIFPRTRRLAGWGSAALLLLVFPANVQMAATAHRRAQGDTGSTSKQVIRVAAVARLPLQLPLIRTALKAAGRLR